MKSYNIKVTETMTWEGEVEAENEQEIRDNLDGYTDGLYEDSTGWIIEKLEEINPLLELAKKAVKEGEIPNE